MADKTKADTGEIDIKRIGVIGAGQMGGGIAHVCAVAGYDVRLSDVSEEQLDRAQKTIAHNMDRQVGHGRLSKAD